MTEGRSDRPGEDDEGLHPRLTVPSSPGPRPGRRGHVRIADEVVGVIAGIAAMEVEGVAGMSGGLVGGLSEMLGKKNPSRGVKVEVGEREAAIDIHLLVEYGVRIPSLAEKVQENVKRAVESMTGLRVVEVNIHIQGVGMRGATEDEVGLK